MASMFSSTTVFTNGGSPDIGNWDVSKVTNMNFMFFNVPGFNQNIRAWNVTSVPAPIPPFYFSVNSPLIQANNPFFKPKATLSSNAFPGFDIVLSLNTTYPLSRFAISINIMDKPLRTTNSSVAGLYSIDHNNSTLTTMNTPSGGVLTITIFQDGNSNFLAPNPINVNFSIS